MQYAIEVLDTDKMSHRVGVGRSWYHAVKAFTDLVSTNSHLITSAKLVMHTESGRKLDTIVRWPKQAHARVA